MRSLKLIWVSFVTLLSLLSLYGCDYHEIYGGYDNVVFHRNETKKSIYGYTGIGRVSITDYNSNLTDTLVPDSTVTYLSPSDFSEIEDYLDYTDYMLKESSKTRCLWLTVESRYYGNELKLTVDHDYPSKINTLYIEGCDGYYTIVIKVTRKQK